MRSIDPRTVVPFIARFSSAMDSKRTTPRSGGTLSMSEMKDWICAACSLFVSARNSDGTAEMVRM